MAALHHEGAHMWLITALIHWKEPFHGVSPAAEEDFVLGPCAPPCAPRQGEELAPRASRPCLAPAVSSARPGSLPWHWWQPSIIPWPKPMEWALCSGSLLESGFSHTVVNESSCLLCGSGLCCSITKTNLFLHASYGHTWWHLRVTLRNC